jgi:hypothetical protein
LEAKKEELAVARELRDETKRSVKENSNKAARSLEYTDEEGFIQDAKTKVANDISINYAQKREEAIKSIAEERENKMKPLDEELDVHKGAQNDAEKRKAEIERELADID